MEEGQLGPEYRPGPRECHRVRPQGVRPRGTGVTLSSHRMLGVCDNISTACVLEGVPARHARSRSNRCDTHARDRRPVP
eukprot:8888207-Pyramimonas_sp.AAC.1